MDSPHLFTDDAMRAHVRRMLAAESAQVEPAGRTDAPAEHKGIGAAPYVSMFGGQGADIATTVAAVKSGRFREANPLGLTGVLAAKGAALTLVPWLMRKLARDGHPTAAKILGHGVGAAGAVPAALNMRTMMKAGR